MPRTPDYMRPLGWRPWYRRFTERTVPFFPSDIPEGANHLKVENLHLFGCPRPTDHLLFDPIWLRHRWTQWEYLPKTLLPEGTPEVSLRTSAIAYNGSGYPTPVLHQHRVCADCGKEQRRMVERG